MGKESSSQAQEPAVVVGVPASSSADASASSDSDGEVAKVHQFNEQTNYVPKRTIITIFLACASVDLTSTVGQLLYGRLSDIWSRKVVLLTGLAIFFIGSLASSLAQSVLQLTVFRAFTGIGGGGLMTVAQLIVSDVVPLRERGKYQGILVRDLAAKPALCFQADEGVKGAVVAIANGIGPVIGGALSSKSSESWRWIFRLNLPLTALTTGCVIFFMPLKKVQGDWKLKLKAVDFGGIFLAFAGMTIFILGMTWGGREYPWNSVQVITTMVIGVVVSIGFVLWQWKGPKYPLVPLHIFKSKIVNGACLTMAINGWNFVMQVYYVPSFYQLVYGYSATKSGALLLPITIIQTISSTLSGLIVHWIGRYRECILFGWVCWAVGLGLMSTLDETTGLGKQIGYALLIGVGVGNTLQPALIATQAGVERRDMAIVTSFRNNNILAGAFSSLNLDAKAAKVLLSNPQEYLREVSPEEADRVRAILFPAYKRGFRIIFIVGASLAAFAFVLAFFLMPQVELSRPDDQKLKEEAQKAHDEKKKKKEAA
ncbi:Efflux pump dotC [Metarhizium anisopliae]